MHCYKFLNNFIYCERLVVVLSQVESPAVLFFNIYFRVLNIVNKTDKYCMTTVREGYQWSVGCHPSFPLTSQQQSDTTLQELHTPSTAEMHFYSSPESPYKQQSTCITSTASLHNTHVLYYFHAKLCTELGSTNHAVTFLVYVQCSTSCAMWDISLDRVKSRDHNGWLNSYRP